MTPTRRTLLVTVLLLVLPALSPALAASFTCTGPSVKVSPPADPYQRLALPAMPSGTVFDARGATFRLRHSSNPDPMGACRYNGPDRLPTNPYPILIDRGGGTPDACFQGGRVVGELSPEADLVDWMGSARKYCNSAAVTLADDRSTRQIVEGMRIDKVWDGVRLYGATCFHNPGACHNVVRDVWISNARDDCIENDGLGGLTVEDSLLDGCFSGISAEPGGCRNCPPSHHDTDEIRITRVLLRLHAFPYRVAGLTADHIGPFKVNVKLGPQLVVRDSVIAFDTAANPKRMASWKASFDKIKSCSNNYLLWLPDTPFPTTRLPRPPSCFTVLTGAAARQHWATARNRWIAAHPDIERIAGDPPAR